MIMLRLRTSGGLDLCQARQLFGPQRAAALQTALQRHEAAGLVSNSYAATDGRKAELYRLTDPEGFLLSNDVMSDCFAAVQKVGSW